VIEAVGDALFPGDTLIQTKAGPRVAVVDSDNVVNFRDPTIGQDLAKGAVAAQRTSHQGSRQTDPRRPLRPGAFPSTIRQPRRHFIAPSVQHRPDRQVRKHKT
jgi:hypothetical protein